MRFNHGKLGSNHKPIDNSFWRVPEQPVNEEHDENPWGLGAPYFETKPSRVTVYQVFSFFLGTYQFMKGVLIEASICKGPFHKTTKYCPFNQHRPENHSRGEPFSNPCLAGSILLVWRVSTKKLYIPTTNWVILSISNHLSLTVPLQLIVNLHL